MPAPYASFEPPRRILMGAGPAPVPDRVLLALSRPTLGHLDPKFIEMMDEVKVMLQATFNTANEVTFAVSAPGSAGMEASVVNLVEPGDKVLIACNGVFSDRLSEHVRRAGGTPVTITAPWGEPIPVDAFEATLKEHPDTRVAAFVHAETSTGVANNVAELSRIAREAGCFTIMDCVTSLGGMPVYVDDWGIDIAYSGTQKCLQGPPGISPITFSQRAVDRIRSREHPVQSWFLDVTLLTGYWGGNTKRTYHHTAPINALYALHEALVLVHEEGLEASWARHTKNAQALRSGLEALGLKYLVADEDRLPMLHAVYIPEGVEDEAIRRRLLDEYGLEVSAGFGPLAGKIWRIGLMGAGSTEWHVRFCTDSLGAVLESAGVDVDRHAALQAVDAAYAS